MVTQYFCILNSEAVFLYKCLSEENRVGSVLKYVNAGQTLNGAGGTRMRRVYEIIGRVELVQTAASQRQDKFRHARCFDAAAGTPHIS